MPELDRKALKEAAPQPNRDAMIERTEAEWDALFDAISTVYGLRAGHVLSEDDIAALALVDKCHREDEETATDCYHRGREEAIRERGGDDLVAIHKRISDLEVKVATANTMKLLAESRTKSATARAEAAEQLVAALLDVLARARVMFRLDLRKMLVFGKHYNQAVRDVHDAVEAAYSAALSEEEA